MYKELSLTAIVGLRLASANHAIQESPFLLMLWVIVMAITALTFTLFLRSLNRQVRANGRFGH